MYCTIEIKFEALEELSGILRNLSDKGFIFANTKLKDIKGNVIGHCNIEE